MRKNAEATIRDNLSANLAMIEPGLELVSVEEYLPSATGTRGFIDILARDRFGNLVIIELKRDDGSAREAIHELYKYLALVRQNHRFPLSRMRCIIVSTEWRELLHPFSEMSRSAPFPVDGIRLIVDDASAPVRAERVEPLPEGLSVEICPYQWLVACETAEGRSRVVRNIEGHLRAAGVGEYVEVLLSYSGKSEWVIFPFVYYFVLGRLPESERGRLLAGNILEVAEYEDAEDEDWKIEEAIISSLHTAVDLEVGTRDFEIGHPDKLGGLINSGWRVDGVLRPGTLMQSAKMFPDEVLLSYAQGKEGQSYIVYSAILSPRHAARWKALPFELERSLRGNDYWGRGVEFYLREVAARWPQATVSIRVYNPLDCLTYLCQAVKRRDDRYLPEVQVFVDNTETDGSTHLLWGQWAASGRRPDSADRLVRSLFGDMDSYLMLHQLHSIWKHEDRVLDAVGLRYQLVEVSGEKDRAPRTFRSLLVESEQCRWEPLTTFPRSFSNYVHENPKFLRGLVATFQRVVWDLG